MIKKATTVAMLVGGGTQTVFGVFHSRVRIGRTGSWSWNVHRAVQVGTITVEAGATADYNDMARSYETRDYPAWRY